MSEEAERARAKVAQEQAKRDRERELARRKAREELVKSQPNVIGR